MLSERRQVYLWYKGTSLLKNGGLTRRASVLVINGKIRKSYHFFLMPHPRRFLRKNRLDWDKEQEAQHQLQLESSPCTGWRTPSLLVSPFIILLINNNISFFTIFINLLISNPSHPTLFPLSFFLLSFPWKRESRFFSQTRGGSGFPQSLGMTRVWGVTLENKVYRAVACPNLLDNMRKIDFSTCLPLID